MRGGEGGEGRGRKERSCAAPKDQFGRKRYMKILLVMRKVLL